VGAALAGMARRTTADGRTAVLAGPVTLDPVFLGAVIVPVLGADSTRVRRLRGAEATKAILAATRVGMLRLGSATTAALDLAGQVSTTVPVWEVHLSRVAQGPDLLPRELIELVGLG